MDNLLSNGCLCLRSVPTLICIKNKVAKIYLKNIITITFETDNKK